MPTETRGPVRKGANMPGFERQLRGPVFIQRCTELGLDPETRAPISRYYDKLFLDFIEERQGVIAGLRSDEIRRLLDIPPEAYRWTVKRLQLFGAVRYEPGVWYPPVGSSVGTWHQEMTWEQLEPTWLARYDAMKLGQRLRKREERREAVRARFNESQRRKRAEKRKRNPPPDKKMGPPPPPKLKPGEIFPDDPNLEAWL